MLSSVYKNLVERVKKNEGFRAEAYLDSLGYPTFGYGSRTIREKYADLNMQDDLKDCIALVEGYIANEGISIDEFRVGILAEMAYQMGFMGVLSFKKMWRALRDMDYERAAAEMKNSRWFKQTPVRAGSLADKMKKGV